MAELREQERKILLELQKLNGNASTTELISKTGMTDAAIMRNALTLQDKRLIQFAEKMRTIVGLTEEGENYAKTGLPERKLVAALQKLGGVASIEDAAKEANLDKQFVSIALGWAHKKKWVSLDSKTKALRIPKETGEGIDERLLKLLQTKGKPMLIEELGLELQDAVQILKGRKLLELEQKTERIIKLTDAGYQLSKKGIKTVKEITQVKPELIVSGKWRNVKLQKYNIQAPVANTWPGKKHPYLQFLDEVKLKLINLGFKEMTGTTVESSFFNFDALYTPQDHPAREIFGIYFVKNPKYGRIDAPESVLTNVKKTHENGWKTGSTGWMYKYNVKEAKRLILRGHGTCLSARTLLSKDLEVPGKYFSIARCYRPEVLDRTHLTEFNQVEGIIVDENLTLRDLLGVLQKFAMEIADADEVRFKPDYFPFTEPSVELSAYKRGYGWVEFGGSGIFRPEVTLPLGIKAPVIAWGLGVDRLFMMKAHVDDIRQIFSSDLNWIRRKEVI